jgi:hypothetical protein
MHKNAYEQFYDIRFENMIKYPYLNLMNDNFLIYVYKNNI